MGEVSTIGLDIAKSVFQIHGVDADGAVVMRKRIRPTRSSGRAHTNSRACSRIPYATEQGIFKRVSGNVFRGTGNFNRAGLLRRRPVFERLGRVSLLPSRSDVYDQNGHERAAFAPVDASCHLSDGSIGIMASNAHEPNCNFGQAAVEGVQSFRSESASRPWDRCCYAGESR